VVTGRDVESMGRDQRRTRHIERKKQKGRQSELNAEREGLLLPTRQISPTPSLKKSGKRFQKTTEKPSPLREGKNEKNGSGGKRGSAKIFPALREQPGEGDLKRADNSE